MSGHWIKWHEDAGEGSLSEVDPAARWLFVQMLPKCWWRPKPKDLLGCLIDDDRRNWSLRDMARIAGLSLGGAKKARDQLFAAGLWRFRADGLPCVPRFTHYQGNGVHTVNACSQSEHAESAVSVHSVNADVHTVNSDVHSVNTDVHTVNGEKFSDVHSVNGDEAPTRLSTGETGKPNPKISVHSVNGDQTLFGDNVEGVEGVEGKRDILSPKTIRFQISELLDGFTPALRDAAEAWLDVVASKNESGAMTLPRRRNLLKQIRKAADESSPDAAAFGFMEAATRNVDALNYALKCIGSFVPGKVGSGVGLNALGRGPTAVGRAQSRTDQFGQVIDDE